MKKLAEKKRGQEILSKKKIPIFKLGIGLAVVGLFVLMFWHGHEDDAAKIQMTTLENNEMFNCASRYVDSGKEVWIHGKWTEQSDGRLCCCNGNLACICGIRE